jgi:flagellar hook-basal body complex protein FliE
VVINPDAVYLNSSNRIIKKEPQSSGFGELFKGIFSNANRQQLKADEAVKELLSGKVEDIHQVMIATEQARLSLQLAVQVTNKMVEAYKDISRIQI